MREDTSALAFDIFVCRFVRPHHLPNLIDKLYEIISISTVVIAVLYHEPLGIPSQTLSSAAYGQKDDKISNRSNRLTVVSEDVPRALRVPIHRNNTSTAQGLSRNRTLVPVLWRTDAPELSEDPFERVDARRL